MPRSTASRPTGTRSRTGSRATRNPISTCYRATGPRALVAVQETAWDALLGWARRRYDVDFATTQGVTHVAQPPATVEQLSHAVEALDRSISPACRRW